MTQPSPSQTNQASEPAYLQRRQERIRQLAAELSDRYPSPQRLTLEAGCGHGHFLTAFAENHPHAQCMGVDLVSKRIRKALNKRDKRDLNNLHFMKGSLHEWLQALPAEHALERIFMLFPDPWPKKRHHKHRMLQPELLSALAQRATPNCRLHFRSDHAANFAWAVEQVVQHPSWEIQTKEPWPFEHSSFFQELMVKYESFTAINSSPTR
ncbi:MAG: tRNA (guanosine(46)-N7)-methyltransferase TrmB [Opitutales bacterium]|nr:tRNA (guanosine(46)-N7)-methyltransferase TrmB [Opitutales bacterium]